MNGYGAHSLTNGRARSELYAELDLLGARRVILSTNIPVRNDGMYYASAREPDDRGVAVYFDLKDQKMVFACDQWKTVKENVWAIAKTINALRGIERWGSGDMLQRAFTGFAALTGTVSQPKEWWEVLMVDAEADFADIRKAYLRLAKENHPDAGGDASRMSEINSAYEKAEAERLGECSP